MNDQNTNSKKVLKIFDCRGMLFVFPLCFLLMFLLVPFLYIFWIATVQGEKSIWEVLKHVVSMPLYRRVLYNTLEISFWVTLLTFLLGYPIAFFISHTSLKREKIILTILISSMWLSILIRSYAWIIMLQRKGPLNSLLMTLGIIGQPINIIFTKFAVIIGMTHILLPYMVLIIWTSMKGFGLRFEQVAYSLGASRTFYFFKVFLPNSMSGILAGVILVFLLSIGFYITPALLGGGNGETMMISMLIEERVNTLGEWKMGSVLAILLLVAITIPLALSWASQTIKGIWQKLFSGVGYDS